jgi:hypothetical protein
MPLSAAIIQCPDCSVKCHFVANCESEMPFSYPGNYRPHQKGSRECLERQIRNLKTRIKQLTEETTGKKSIILLHYAGRAAVVIDNSPEEAIQRAHMCEPDGGWKHAAANLICRVRASRTARVLAMDQPKNHRCHGYSDPLRPGSL